MQACAGRSPRIMMFQTQSHYTAVPGENHPKGLLISFQKSILESFQEHIESVAFKTRIDLNYLQEKITQIDPATRLSPALFGVYARLRDAYRGNHLESIFESLQALRMLHQDQLYAPKRGYSSILTDAWESHSISEIRREALSSQEDIQMLPLLHWHTEDFPPVSLKQAETIISELEPAMWHEIEIYVSHIKLFLGKALESVTSPRYFGAIYLRLPSQEEDPIAYYISTVLHETAHLHLFAMMSGDKLVLNTENELFASPLRKDKRPMTGILHATFVLSRMIRFFRKYVACFEVGEATLNMLLKSENLFSEGIETIRQNARLTEAGTSLFNSLEPCSFE